MRSSAQQCAMTAHNNVSAWHAGLMLAQRCLAQTRPTKACSSRPVNNTCWCLPHLPPCTKHMLFVRSHSCLGCIPCLCPTCQPDLCTNAAGLAPACCTSTPSAGSRQACHHVHLNPGPLCTIGACSFATRAEQAARLSTVSRVASICLSAAAISCLATALPTVHSRPA